MNVQDLVKKYSTGAPATPTPNAGGTMSVSDLANKYKNYSPPATQNNQPTPSPYTSPGQMAAAPGGGSPSFGTFFKNLIGGGKDAANALTTSEQGFGKEVATAIAAPGAQKAVDTQNAQESQFLQQATQIRDRQKSQGKDTSKIDAMIMDMTPAKVSDSLPAVNDTSADVLKNAAGVGLDVASGGTFGKTATAGMDTGKLAIKSTPTLASGAGKVADKILAPSEKAGVKISGKILDAVSPKLTKKETADAIAKRGATKSGFLGRIRANIDPAIKKVADAVEKNVPDFDPKKTFSKNVNATKSAVYKMADDLKTQVMKSGKDVIYPFKELASRMNSIEKPIAIKADATLEKQFNLAKDAALKIAQKSGGKISDLLGARKEFDSLVQKQFPNLYDRENAPMRDAITSIRGTMNDFIAEKLPDVKFKDSLSTQSKLFTAIDNMSEKAVSEIDTNVIERAGQALKNHPVLSGALAAAGYEEAKKIPIVGQFLP